MLFSATFAALATLAQVSLVAAHGGVLSYNIAGTTYNGFVAYNTATGQSSIQREWDTYDPIQDPTNSYMSCNTNGANLGSGQEYAIKPTSWIADHCLLEVSAHRQLYVPYC